MMLVGFMVVEDSWWAAGTVHHWDSCNASTCMIPRSSVSGQRPVLGLITPGSEYDLLPLILYAVSIAFNPRPPFLRGR